MYPHLVAGVAGGVDAADVCDLQKAVGGDGGDHEADLVGVSGHQHPEGGVGIDGRGDVAQLVHGDGIGDGQHMVIDLFFDLRFVAGNAVAAQQLHEKFLIHKVPPVFSVEYSTFWGGAQSGVGFRSVKGRGSDAEEMTVCNVFSIFSEE